MKVDHYEYDHPREGRGKAQNARVKAGRPKVTRIVPPAGEEYAFKREDYPLNVDVYESPTGRSVRLFINGQEVDWRNL